jgi:hypothetical protein
MLGCFPIAGRSKVAPRTARSILTTHVRPVTASWAPATSGTFRLTRRVEASVTSSVSVRWTARATELHVRYVRVTIRRSTRMGCKTMIATAATLLVGALAVGVPFTRSAVEAQHQGTLIESPGHWVPYTVEKELVSTTGGGEITAVIEHRGSDGSTMNVQRVEGNPAHIAITNRSTGLSYFFDGDRWVSSPANQTRSPRTALDSRTVTMVSPDDQRIAALVGLGLQVYEHRNPTTGTVNLLCPELNMLAVWFLHPRSGLEERVTGIVLGEPPVEFAPPDGSEIAAGHVPVPPTTRYLNRD